MPSSRTRITLLLALLTPLLAACAEPDARITITAKLAPPLELGMLTVKVDDGSRVVTLTGSDFAPLAGGQQNGRTLETANHGTLTVSYTIATPGAPTSVSSGSIELPLREDWSYGVDVRADTTDPRRFCFGCIGSKAFPLPPAMRSAQADSIYLVWGGNSISHPVIY